MNMPKFPTYYGPPLPEQLNLLNPSHWWILLSWVFFHPSRFKQYLYQADPELYRAKGLSALGGILLHPCYRPLMILSYLLIPITYFFYREVVVSIFNEMSVLFFVIYWGIILLPFLLQNTAKVLVGNISSGLSCIIFFGIIYIGFQLARLIWGGTDLSANRDGVVAAIFISYGFALAICVRPMLQFGLIFALLYSIQLLLSGLDILLGGFIVGLLLGSLLPPLVLPTGSNGIIRSILFVDASGVLYLSNTKHLYKKLLITAPEKALQILNPLLQDSLHCHIAFRFINDILYKSDNPIYLLYTWLKSPQMDEYIFAPIDDNQFESIPTLRRALFSSLANESINVNGGRFGNFFWKISRFMYGSQADHPLISLVRLLLQLEKLSNVRGDIDQHLLDTLDNMELPLFLREYPYSKEIEDSFEIMKRAFNIDSIANIALLYPDLTKIDTKYTESLRPDVWQIIAALADISGEIVDYTKASSFNTKLSTLNRAQGLLNRLIFQDNRTRIDLISSSLINASDFRAQKRIDIMSYVSYPEKCLLNEIAEYWLILINEEADLVGKRDLLEMDITEQQAMKGRLHRSNLWGKPPLPFENPYITGRPVRPPIFVGRSKIMNKIVTSWHTKSHTPDSIILYGHRRMGKTSIAQNLADYAPTDSLLVYLDLAGAMAIAEHIGDLLLELADRLYAEAVKHIPHLTKPKFDDYQQSTRAKHHFQNLLRQVIGILPEEAFLILVIDEFEALDQAVEEGILPDTIYAYLRSLSSEDKLTLIFVGLHTLDEMSRDYEQAFFGSYANQRVSYLSYKDSEQLIARPTPDFILNYEQKVLREIHDCTHGQPLLVQSICSALVNHINHELFDLELEREARVLPEDLEAVLNDDFIRQESRYFEGVWQDQIADFPDQRLVLSALAKHDDGMAKDELATALALADVQLSTALEALEKRDLIADADGRWRLLMPLFRRWLLLHSNEVD